MSFPRIPGKVALATAITLSLLAATATAQAPAKIEPRALALVFLNNDRPDLACDLLKTVFGTDTTQPDVLLMLATCSRDQGQDEAAVSYYRRLIAIMPNAQRPHAELGALYLRMGRLSDAQAEFALAAKAAPGSRSALALDRLVQDLGVIGDPAALAARQPKFWQVELFSGLTRDTNINAGPASSSIAAVIGGVPATLTLTDDSRPREAWGWVNSANIRYLKPLNERFALLSQGALAKTYYFGEGEFDNDSVAGATSLIYRSGDFSASLQPSITAQRLDNDMSQVDYGVTMRLTQVLVGGLGVTSSLGYVYRDIRSNDDRTNKGALGSFGVNYRFASGIETGGEILVQREDAREGIYSRSLYGPVLYASAALSPEIFLAASYRYARSEYDEREAIFPDLREDRQQVFGVTADWNIARWTMNGLALRAQYAYIRNESTVDVYEYDRHIGTLGALLRF